MFKCEDYLIFYFDVKYRGLKWQSFKINVKKFDNEASKAAFKVRIHKTLI